jgi:hypothetical protein
MHHLPGHPSRHAAWRVRRSDGKQPFLSQALADQYGGVEATGDGVWNIVYCRALLRRIDERTTTTGPSVHPPQRGIGDLSFTCSA